MQNTWSIGRTWKPREGWSRPVLTDERQHQHSNPWRLDRIFLLQTAPDGNEHCLATRRNIDISASAVRFPGRHRPADPSVWPYKRRFAAAMAQVRRPVPFRTRKLRPGTAMVLHPTGCGRVARRRTTRTGSPLEHTPQGAPSISGHPRVGVFLASLGLSVLGLPPPRSAARTAPLWRGARETSWAPTGFLPGPSAFWAATR